MLSGPSQVPLILVVDDSITVRRVTRACCSAKAYRVALAPMVCRRWSACRKSGPVVLSDIEMPAHGRL